MLKDPPLLTVRRSFQRPPRELMAKLDGAQTGHIVDAMQGRAALDHRIKPVDPECAQFVGPALTCQTGADDNLAILAALALAEPGDVIVMATDGIRSGFVSSVDVTVEPQPLAEDIVRRFSKGTDDALALVARYDGGGA